MRILIAEDDRKLAASLQETLQQAGYNVTAAYDGLQAWELAFVEDFDLIILDISLPGKDGLSILHDLREEKVDTPVIFLTARDKLEDRIQGLDSGADDYLSKPFPTAELLARVRVCLRRKFSVSHPVIRVGRLEVNTLSHEVVCGGKNISLTPREYGILELLLFNMNRVVSRLTIAEHVWGDNFDLMTNVVDVHINNLRRKLEINENNPIIETVWGVGYIIKDNNL
jgi:DNA-binding response OmpR family regulator